MKNIDLYIGSGGGEGARRAAGGIKTCRDDEQIQGKNEGKMFASSTLTVDKLHEFCLDFFFSVFMLHTRDGGK